MRKLTHGIPGLIVIAMNCLLSACGSLTSPVDQAYYNGGSVFSIPGGYTRTIFSSNNF